MDISITSHRFFFTSIIFLLIAPFFSPGCGTLGGISSNIVFPTSKQQLDKALDSLFSRHAEFKIPDKWKRQDDWIRAGYGFMEYRIFYFAINPEEMYYVTYIGDSSDLTNPRRATIAIRAIYNGGRRWLLAADLDRSEIRRVDLRFGKEIVPVLENYTATKAHFESPYF